MSRVVDQTGIVPYEAPPGWAFGGAPADLKGAFKSEKVGGLGAGDVWEKFNMHAARLLDASYSLSDPGRPDAAEKAQAKGISAQMVNGIGEMPKDTLVVFNNTPPHIHHEKIVEAIAAGLPIATEKPIVTSPADMKKLQAIAENTPVPLISVDWIYGQSQVLRAVVGEEVPFARYVKIAKDSHFKEFDWNNLTSVSVHSVEGGGNALSAGAMERQGMGDSNKGGGVLWDMLIHQTTLLSHMKLNTHAIGDVVLGSPKILGKADSRRIVEGTYDRFGKEDGSNSRGEIYGRAEVLLQDKNGRHIPATYEVGKFGDHNHQEIVFNDAKGNTLRWQTVMNNDQGQVTNAGGSWVELTNNKGEVRGFASQAADAYVLVLADAMNIARDFRDKRAKAKAHYLEDQVNPTFAIAAMHAFGRREPVNEVANQLQLDYRRPDFKFGDYIPITKLVA